MLSKIAVSEEERPSVIISTIQRLLSKMASKRTNPNSDMETAHEIANVSTIINTLTKNQPLTKLLFDSVIDFVRYEMTKKQTFLIASVINLKNVIDVVDLDETISEECIIYAPYLLTMINITSIYYVSTYTNDKEKLVEVLKPLKSVLRKMIAREAEIQSHILKPVTTLYVVINYLIEGNSATVNEENDVNIALTLDEDIIAITNSPLSPSANMDEQLLYHLINICQCHLAFVNTCNPKQTRDTLPPFYRFPAEFMKIDFNALLAFVQKFNAQKDTLMSRAPIKELYQSNHYQRFITYLITLLSRANGWVKINLQHHAAHPVTDNFDDPHWDDWYEFLNIYSSLVKMTDILKTYPVINSANLTADIMERAFTNIDTEGQIPLLIARMDVAREAYRKDEVSQFIPDNSSDSETSEMGNDTVKPKDEKKKQKKKRKKKKKTTLDTDAVNTAVSTNPTPIILATNDTMDNEKIPTIIHTVSLPEHAIRIIGKLESAGLVTYVVGGTNRDARFNFHHPDSDHKVDDIDLVCTGSFEAIKIALKDENGSIVGNNYPVFSIKSNDEIEVQICPMWTTEKSDNPSYLILANGKVIKYNPTSSIRKDASHRDFRHDAMYYRNGIIFDPCNGDEDIKNKQLSFINPTDSNLKRDPALILRTIRQVSKFGFKLNAEDATILLNNFMLIANIPFGRLDLESHKALKAECLNIGNLKNNLHPDCVLIFVALAAHNKIVKTMPNFFSGTKQLEGWHYQQLTSVLKDINLDVLDCYTVTCILACFTQQLNYQIIPHGTNEEHIKLASLLLMILRASEPAPIVYFSNPNTFHYHQPQHAPQNGSANPNSAPTPNNSNGERPLTYPSAK
jgi:hypothetical protein